MPYYEDGKWHEPAVGSTETSRSPTFVETEDTIISAPLTPLLTDGSSGDVLLEVRMAEVMREAFELWKARHRKYGRLNISMFQEVGCVVRAGDKISRLAEALLHNKGMEEKDETVEDSFRDLANYALMGLLCYRGLWSAPTVGSEK